MRKFLGSLLEIVEIAAIAILAVWFVRGFLIQPFLVSGESMIPTFENGDYLLIDELTYRVRSPERGEVVVFRYPKDESTYFIKRVIGLPGERVKVEEGNVIVYNTEHPDGLTLQEPYLPANMETEGARDIRLGKDEYYTLGDNRPYSFDSRRWGALPKKDIVGIARWRLWPVGRAAAIEVPTFN